MKEMTSNRPMEDEIDLLELWYAIERRIWLVLLAGVAVAGIALAITMFLITPMYTSSSTMFVVTKETTLSSLADLQLGSQLTNDYKILIMSRPVLERTIQKLDLDMTYKNLREAVSISNPNDSRMLIVSVKQPDPELAKQVVDTLVSISADYISDKMEVTAPKIIEEGEVALYQTSPNVWRNTAVGAMLGILAAVLMISASVILNDSIQTEEDIDKYLALPVLAVVPDKKSDSSSIKSGKRRKKTGGRTTTG